MPLCLSHSHFWLQWLVYHSSLNYKKRERDRKRGSSYCLDLYVHVCHLCAIMFELSESAPKYLGIKTVYLMKSHSYTIFAAITVHTSTLLDRHTNPLFQHIAIITSTSRHTSLIVCAVWCAMQMCTGWTAGIDTCGVMTVLWARGRWGDRIVDLLAIVHTLFTLVSLVSKKHVRSGI